MYDILSWHWVLDLRYEIRRPKPGCLLLVLNSTVRMKFSQYLLCSRVYVKILSSYVPSFFFLGLMTHLNHPRGCGLYVAVYAHTYMTDTLSCCQLKMSTSECAKLFYHFQPIRRTVQHILYLCL